MKIKVSKLRSIIREAYEHASHEALKALAKAAIADMEAGGRPEDVYRWLAAETDLGGGRHRADAVVGLVRKADLRLGMKLSHAGEPFRSAPPAYVAPWSGTSGKMYESDGE